LDIALGLKPEPIIIKTAIDRVLLKTISTDGLEAAVKQYYDLKKNQSQAYEFGERLLNNLGYNFMRRGKFKEAMRIFQLNVEAYPQSSNVYDSLGEAYMNNGDKAAAIENDEKSIKLNPENTNGVEMLKKLRAQ
jgi:D-alanyl-D-alanine-carboxypeptidase/D-alanyl-D-alanine-endopeptidase